MKQFSDSWSFVPTIHIDSNTLHQISDWFWFLVFPNCNFLRSMVESFPVRQYYIQIWHDLTWTKSGDTKLTCPTHTHQNKWVLYGFIIVLSCFVYRHTCHLWVHIYIYIIYLYKYIYVYLYMNTFVPSHAAADEANCRPKQPQKLLKWLKPRGFDPVGVCWCRPIFGCRLHSCESLAFTRHSQCNLWSLNNGRRRTTSLTWLCLQICLRSLDLFF